MMLIWSAVAPALILLIWIYMRDRLHPEPKRLVIRLFLLGALVVLPAGLIERELLIMRVTGTGIYGVIVTAFLVAGMVEEFLKAAVVQSSVYRHPAYDEPIDGVVYAVAVSLGFAAVENILYVTGYGLSVAVTRAVTAVPAHMMFGITMGYSFSRAKMGQMGLWVAYLVPALLHGIYDTLAMTEGLLGQGILLLYLLFLIWLSHRRVEWLLRQSMRPAP
jgi:RsiW-degrading membrane proteinase PrsW (M82 family)